MTTFRSGYGDLTYGNLLYGIDAALVFGDPAVSLTSTASANGVVIKDAAVSVALGSTVTASGYTAITGHANTSISSTVTVRPNRIMSFAAEDSISSSSTLSSRYKWLPASDPTNTWTDASDPTTTWADADYLEKAA